MAHDVKYSSTGKKHPFHIVEPSPWPLLSSAAAAFMAWGAVELFHDGTWWAFLVGLAALVFCAWRWWADVVRETTHEKVHTDISKKAPRLGMLLFIASEAMFFFAFFWAYFNAALFPPEVIGSVWPPEGIEPINPFDLPFMMTMILLLSGSTVTWAHHEILRGHNDEAVKALWITVLLGIVFSGFQFYEYHHVAFGLGDNIYSSVFYIATGFHGLHVIIGTIFLAVCAIRAQKGHFTPKDHFGFEAAAWYWHFVDVVWLFLFVAIYWWGG